MKRIVITPLIVGVANHSPGHDLMKRLGERDLTIKHYNAKGNIDLLSEVLKDVSKDYEGMIVIEDLDTLFGHSPLTFIIDSSDNGATMVERTMRSSFLPILNNKDVDWMIDKPLTLANSDIPKHNREQVNCRGKGNVKPKDNRKTIKQARKTSRKSKGK